MLTSLAGKCSHHKILRIVEPGSGALKVRQQGTVVVAGPDRLKVLGRRAIWLGLASRHQNQVSLCQATLKGNS